MSSCEGIGKRSPWPNTGGGDSIFNKVSRKELFPSNSPKKPQESPQNFKKPATCATPRSAFRTNIRRQYGRKKEIVKALSLTDLNSKEGQAPLNRRPLGRMQREDVAAGTVYKALLLNAYRCRSVEARRLTLSVEDLNTQIRKLEIQIGVLKKLLESEKERVHSATTELTTTVTQLEQIRTERDALETERDRLSVLVARLEEERSCMEVKFQNLSNDFLSAKDEKMALESQVTKEREKLKKLREDKKCLLEKLQSSEDSVTRKLSMIDKLQATIHELERNLQQEKESCSKKHADLQAATSAIKDLEQQHVQLVTAVSDLEAKNRILETKISGEEAEVKKSQTVINEQRGIIESLQSGVAECSYTLCGHLCHGGNTCCKRASEQDTSPSPSSMPLPSSSCPTSPSDNTDLI